MKPEQPLTRLERLAHALIVVTTMPPAAKAELPCTLKNALNGSGGTTKGARYLANMRRAKDRVVGHALARHLGVPPKFTHGERRCIVLTRVSPRSFDDDGTTAALKSVRDGMAEWWGIDDADPCVTWVTDWRKGKRHVVEAALWVLP